MKNRVKRHLRNMPSLEDLIKDVEDEAKKILDSRKSHAYVELQGRIPLNQDGDIDTDRPDIIDINAFRNFCDFIRDRETDFNKDDVKRLMILLPHVIAIKKWGIAFTPLDHALFIAERISGIPTDRYIDRHHKKIGEDKANAVESIELAKALIEAMLTIQDADTKALSVMMLTESIPFLEDNRDGIERDDDYYEDEDPDLKTLNTAERYGIDKSLINKGFELREKHFEESKPRIDKIMKEKKE